MSTITVQTIIKKIFSRKRGLRTTKVKSPLKPHVELHRLLENPIISPVKDNDWESWQTFNPGVVLLDDKIHFFYRAIGEDGISRLGYASSNDGFHIEKRLSFPIYEHPVKQRFYNIYSYFSGGSFGGCEDPRIVQIEGEDVLYMTYTACDLGLRVALTSIKVKDFSEKRWKWMSPKLISPPDELHKNWVIFPKKIKGKYAILHSISPRILIDYVDSLDFNDGYYLKSYYNGYSNRKRKNCWDSWIRGAGPAPIETPDGWLLFYHAIDKHDPGKYKVGAMLLDLEEPTKILHRCQEPVLEPKRWYENDGFKSGVVYVSGAVVKNGELFVYYGGADSYVCVASAPLKEFLEAFKIEAKPKLSSKVVRKKRNDN